MAELKHLRSLWVGLNRTTFTDVGLRNLSGLTALEGLDLQGSSVDDRGVAALKDFHELRTLYLGATKGAKEKTISDASLDTLLAMTKLVHLGLTNTTITKESAKRLIALPALQAIHPGKPRSERRRNGMSRNN